MNDTTKTTADVLAERYMLVRLGTQKFYGTKTDRVAGEHLTQDTNAVRGAAKVVKNLFAGADAELKAVNANIDFIRSTFYSMTLPWSSSDDKRTGARLLNNLQFFTFVARMNKGKEAVEKSTEVLAKVYNERRNEAVNNLGSLADTTDYPTWAEVEARFKVSFTYVPVPALSDYSRITLPQGAVDRLVEMAAKDSQTMQENAMADAWKRLVDPLERVVAQCGKEKGRIFDSLFDNLEDLVENLKYFNINDDPELEQVRKDIASKLCVHDASAVRNSVTAKRDAAQAAADILKTVKSVGRAV